MAESDFVKRELAKNVFMYTKRTDVEKEVPGYVGVKETTIEYAVECSAFRELEFTLTWGEGTENLAWPEDPEAKSITVKCLPYERKPLVKLVQQGMRARSVHQPRDFSQHALSITLPAYSRPQRAQIYSRVGAWP